DADMEELPADAAAVALTLTVAGDAVAYLIELAELFDVEMDHLAGLLAFISPGWPGWLQGAQLAQPQSTRLTVAGETPTVVAISLPGMRWRRRLSMRSITSGGVGLRSRCGRELRSCSPTRPSCSRRSRHLRPVRGQTPAASLAAS